MQEPASVQKVPDMNLIGLWSAKIPQDSLDHLAHVLMRRTKHGVATCRIGRYVYVYVGGDPKVASLHFDMISPRPA